MTTKKFAKLTILTQKNQKKIYVVLSYKLFNDEKQFSRDRRRFIKCETLEINEFELFEFIKNLIKIFSKTLFDNFNTYNQIEYFIDFKKNKIFKSKSIYNMSQNELATIREYFENTQKKNEFVFQAFNVKFRYYL